MGAAVMITRLDRSAAELRREASRCGDGRVACRMLAIAHVIDGASRAEAAQACGMDRQTLRLERMRSRDTPLHCGGDRRPCRHAAPGAASRAVGRAAGRVQIIGAGWAGAGA